MSEITRDKALELLKKHNKEPFHIQHALTVEGVMRYFARKEGFEEDEEYWGLVGLLHDIDFEEYPEEHCIKAPELLREGGVSEDIIHSVCSHGYGLTETIAKPEHMMEKILFATDELTGIIGAAALMRPSKSTKDMELKSLRKKYKSKGFAAGCSREVIERGAEMIGWELNKLLEDTLIAMRECEDSVAEAMKEYE
ncbi:MAG: hydrolase [Firmicutes bacterium]|nr:hydrolase [Bacillota bacterium]